MIYENVEALAEAHEGVTPNYSMASSEWIRSITAMLFASYVHTLAYGRRAGQNDGVIVGRISDEQLSQTGIYGRGDALVEDSSRLGKSAYDDG